MFTPYNPRPVGVLSTEQHTQQTNVVENRIGPIANIYRLNTTNSNRTTTRHLRAPILTCHNASVSPLANFPCVTDDNTERVPRIESELLHMHLRDRSGVMYTRWLFKHMQNLVHTSMSTKYCRPSHNAQKIMNAFTCDPDLQRATPRFGKRLDPLCGLHGSMANVQRKVVIFRFAHTQNLAQTTQKLPTRNTKHDVAKHRNGH